MNVAKVLGDKISAVLRLLVVMNVGIISNYWRGM